MEFAVIIGIFAVITFFMPWINFVRHGNLRGDIDTLKARIRELESQLQGKKAIVSDKEQIEDAQPDPSGEQIDIPVAPAKPVIEPKPVPVTVPHVAKTQQKKASKPEFEFNMATKLPVWIGSISLILAAFFLVKYSIEFGWLGPLARVSLGGLFAASLIAGGDFISKRPKISNALRISQGLIGAGIVGLYVSLYAAINLYNLIDPLTGFIGMSVVTALAVIFSLRHGQPIAVFGLLGGLLTPALVSTQEPNTIALFTYLFLLFSGLCVVLIRKGWWTLAIVTLTGMFAWSAFWLTVLFVESETFILLLFSIAMTTVILATTGKRLVEDTFEPHEKTSAHILNMAAISGGTLTVFWISAKVTISLFDWSMLGLFSLALITLAYFKQEVYQKPLIVKLLSSLILLLFWAPAVPLENALSVIAGLSLVYIGTSSVLMRKTSDPRFWALLQCSAALSVYLVSYIALDLPEWWMNAFGMFWGILSLILAGISAYQAADIRQKYKAHETIQRHLLTIYCLFASAFISLGFAIEMPWAYMPLAFAAQIAATAWVYQRTDIQCLKTIMYVLTLVFVALNYEQILLFAGLVLHSLVAEIPPAEFVNSYTLDNPLPNLGLPAALLYGAFWLTIKKEKQDKKLLHSLFGTASVFIMFTAYYLFRMVFHEGDGNIFASEIGFIERGILTITLGCIGIGALEFIRKHGVNFLKPWGEGLFRMAITRLIYFDLLLHNPYFADSQFVGDTPLLNGITLTYGFALIFGLWALYRNNLVIRNDFEKKSFSGLCLASIFALTTFNISQYYHGGFISSGDVSSGELYAYSVAWLLTGLGILAAGIKKDDKPIRMAAMAFIALTVCKVFLIDAADLEGLYRVASFLGLGVSLIGLSFFYTRFVSSKGHEGLNVKQTSNPL